MRAPHTTHQLPTFPVYSSAFLSQDKLVLGGGGGSSKTGIKNKLRLYSISPESLDLINEFEFEKGEDAPMSMAYDENTHSLVCGVNAVAEKMEKGENEHCRVFTIKNDSIEPHLRKQLIKSPDLEVYQKVTVLSPTQGLVAVGSTNNEVHVLRFPSLNPVISSIKIPEGELSDATFGTSTLVVVSLKNMYIYTLPGTESDTSPAESESQANRPSGPITLLRTIEKPTLPKVVQGTTVSFRTARFHPQDNEKLYVILNTAPPSGSRGGKRGAYLACWNAKTWELGKVRKIADAGATGLEISPNGRLLAYALSDCSIGVRDSETFSPLLRILKAHDFPATTLRFNPTGTLLVSGSADNSVRIVSVPDRVGGSWTYTLLIILTILIVLLAIFYQISQT